MKPELYKFKPYLKPTIWGGRKIAEFKHLASNSSCIGESWEISGVPGHESVVAEGRYAGKTLSELMKVFGASLIGEAQYAENPDYFPLIIKIIDANDDLSIQVHPDDELAHRRHDCPGKTEMWYILETMSGAKIYTGFRSPMSREDFHRSVADLSFMEAVNSYDSKPGDVYFIPAGRVHSIGAGNLLAEIQQSCDVTYRIYDYGRKDSEGKTRELHVEEAKDAINYSDCHNCGPIEHCESGDDEKLLMECKKFIVKHERVNGSRKIENKRDSFAVLICIKGEVTVGCEAGDVPQVDIRQGETMLVPAIYKEINLKGDAEILYVTV